MSRRIRQHPWQSHDDFNHRVVVRELNDGINVFAIGPTPFRRSRDGRDRRGKNAIGITHSNANTDRADVQTQATTEARIILSWTVRDNVFHQ